MTTRADLLRTIRDAERGGDYQLAERLRAELAKLDEQRRDEHEDHPRPAIR